MHFEGSMVPAAQAAGSPATENNMYSSTLDMIAPKSQDTVNIEESNNKSERFDAHATCDAIFLNAIEVEMTGFLQDASVTSLHNMNDLISLTESTAVTKEVAVSELEGVIEASRREVQARKASRKPTLVPASTAQPVAVHEKGSPAEHVDFTPGSGKPAQSSEEERGGVWWSVGMDKNAMIRLG